MKKLISISLLLFLLMFIFFFGKQLFSVWTSEVIYQGQGKVPFNLRLANQILDFDRGETTLQWSFDTKHTYYQTSGGNDIKHELLWWVAKIDNVSVASGFNPISITTYSSSNAGKEFIASTSGSIDLTKYNFGTGRHYLDVYVATLPPTYWMQSSYYSGVLGYWFNDPYCSCVKTSSGDCDNEKSKCLFGDYDVAYRLYGCFLKRCGYNSCIRGSPAEGYFSTAIYDDLANGYVCKYAVKQNYTKVYYQNNCEKCGKASEEWKLESRVVYCTAGYSTSYPFYASTCNYDKCVLWYGNYNGLCPNYFVTENKGTYTRGQSIPKTYITAFEGYNYYYTCNSCYVDEPTECGYIDYTAENPYRGMFTVTKLTIDFVICKNSICTLCPPGQVYDMEAKACIAAPEWECNVDEDCSKYVKCPAGVKASCDAVTHKCKFSGECIYVPPKKSIWDEIVSLWQAFWSWILSKLGWF